MYIIYILEILIQSVTVDHSEEKKSEFSKSPGGGNSHMKQMGMLIGNFEFNR